MFVHLSCCICILLLIIINININNNNNNIYDFYVHSLIFHSTLIMVNRSKISVGKVNASCMLLGSTSVKKNTFLFFM